MESDRLLTSYLYDLPPESIAQTPIVPRDHSKLLVVEPVNEYPNPHSHRQFFEIADLLRSGDLLVFNNTKVIPARLHGHKDSGAKIEVLLLAERAPNTWLALVKPGRKILVGSKLVFPAAGLPDLVAEVIDRDPPSGGRVLRFLVPENRPLLEILDNYGEIPFPPYVTASEATVEQYQTAGLHFTPELLQKLLDRGIKQATVTLHVGVGTFRPVTVEDITQHEMHGEWLTVSAKTVEQVLITKAQGGRVFAVGTTTVRCLETAAQNGEMQPYSGQTNIFIYPGYQWRLVDGLITNFHLPGSSLMMLVGALIGRQRLLDLYEIAIDQDYRFYSFGDAMLILPH
jgi:S-adenosylmethionine:tRNA ribosyltransferase-isomerase